ncbi:S1 RNA-binding domain-containing protein [Halobacillus sp. BBL2006]|uniref:CvfB family protein n=1 Tax=Halobacillus sp. BBL2006 TaxID=1543706 RepID=UPI00054247AB|nr:S1-like domain-containing RNA-binding protein [Halobacillus sp. BBL2006]KHE67189.1 hypothetical protein LD39_18800 [Halobacillus sp. BBL2006]
MNHQILGTIQKAKVLKKIVEGFVVTVQDSEVTLPDEYASDDIELDQDVEVFLYENKKGQAVATMNLPEATKDAYGWAEVVEVLPHMGVFVNIGLEDKDILVSSDNLPLLKSVWPKEGDNLFVSLEADKKGRLLAEPISEYEVIEDLEKAPDSLLHTVIAARVYRSTKAGSAILTEEGYRGFIHPHERKDEPRLGETVEGRVIDVKEDGTINVSLRPLKQESMKEDADVIFDYLIENDGVMELHDKSDPQEIRERFHISKAAFKRALGQLMKDGKIEQKEGRTTIKHD